MKKVWIYSLSLLLFLNFLLFISCRKEDENEIPTVTINSPAANTSYQIYDTVLLQAQATDDKLITRLVVQLKDENNVPVLSKQVTVNSASYELYMDFPLNDPKLNGSYYFDVRAYDADNFASAFRFINIGGKSKNIDKIFLFTEGINSTEISELTAEKTISRNVIPGDFLGSAIDVDRNILYSIGEFNGDLVAMDTNGLEKWNFQSGKLPQVPFFNDLHFHNKEIFGALDDGRILGFDDKGNQMFQKVLISGFAPYQLFRHEDCMIYEKIEKNSGKVFLTNNYHPSGLLKGEIVFAYGRIIHLVGINWNRVLIFSNDINTPYILEFNTENISLTKIYFDQGSPLFKNVVRISDNILVILKGNDLMKYYIEQRLLMPFKDSFAPDIMRYDENSNVIYCAFTRELIRIDASSGDEINRIQSDKNIDSFELYSSY